MPRYDFRCPRGHVTELECRMADVPSDLACPAPRCKQMATRVFSPPAAIHFRGPGFYSTDVTGRVGRKRRANAGDDLPLEFDTGAARIADAI